MSFFKRLLIVIWVPPILAVSPMFIAGILTAFSHGGNAAISAKDQLLTLLMFLGFSFGYCLVPSLVAWSAMELVWKLRGSKSHQRAPSQLMGATLGLVSGAVINSFIYTFGFWSVRAVPDLLTGLICGLVVATLIHPRPALAALSEAGASLPAKKEPIFWKYLRRALLLVAGVLGSFALLSGGFKLVWWWEYYLPSEQHVRRQFADHRNEFEQFVAELKNDPKTTLIDESGRVYDNGMTSRIVPKYGELFKKIDARNIRVGEDGSIEFALWGSGGAIQSDSYMGILYVPPASGLHPQPGWGPTVVKSLDDSKLPHEHGSVATGLYVVPIEAGWYVYRLEYQE